MGLLGKMLAGGVAGAAGGMLERDKLLKEQQYKERRDAALQKQAYALADYKEKQALERQQIGFEQAEKVAATKRGQELSQYVEQGRRLPFSELEGKDLTTLQTVGQVAEGKEKTDYTDPATGVKYTRAEWEGLTPEQKAAAGTPKTEQAAKLQAEIDKEQRRLQDDITRINKRAGVKSSQAGVITPALRKSADQDLAKLYFDWGQRPEKEKALIRERYLLNMGYTSPEAKKAKPAPGDKETEDLPGTKIRPGADEFAALAKQTLAAKGVSTGKGGILQDIEMAGPAAQGLLSEGGPVVGGVGDVGVTATRAEELAGAGREPRLETTLQALQQMGQKYGGRTQDPGRFPETVAPTETPVQRRRREQLQKSFGGRSPVR